jgi:hypothetical protein
MDYFTDYQGITEVSNTIFEGIREQRFSNTWKAWDNSGTSDHDKGLED